MSAVPVCSQILAALQVLFSQPGIGAATVDIDRDNEAEPYTTVELPAINIIPVEENVSAPNLIGAGLRAPVWQDVSLTVVLQIVSRGGSDPAAQARLISAACEAALAADPTLGGLCPQVVRITGRQWLRDDSAEQRLARMNTRLECVYRTRANDPYTPY